MREQYLFDINVSQLEKLSGGKNDKDQKSRKIQYYDLWRILHDNYKKLITESEQNVSINDFSNLEVKDILKMLDDILLKNLCTIEECVNIDLDLAEAIAEIYNKNKDIIERNMNELQKRIFRINFKHSLPKEMRLLIINHSEWFLDKNLEIYL